MKTSLMAFALGLSAVFSTQVAHAADDFPSKPIHLIVPFSPGASTDMVTRLVGAKVSQILGQSVVVENRAGAGGSLGPDVVARAQPAGHPLVVAPTAPTAHPFIYTNLPHPTAPAYVPMSTMVVQPAPPVPTP